jgi:hypothetical protein
LPSWNHFTTAFAQGPNKTTKDDATDSAIQLEFHLAIQCWNTSHWCIIKAPPVSNWQGKPERNWSICTPRCCVEPSLCSARIQKSLPLSFPSAFLCMAVLSRASGSWAFVRGQLNCLLGCYGIPEF